MESDNEDAMVYDPHSDADSQTSETDAYPLTGSGLLSMSGLEMKNLGSDKSQAGMLPRDLPTRTAYYDSVAERQMSQTDAKLFYNPSQGPRAADPSHTGVDAAGFSGSGGKPLERTPSIPTGRPGGPTSGAEGTRDDGVNRVREPGFAQMPVSNGFGNSSFVDSDPLILRERAEIFGRIQRVVDIRRKYIAKSLQRSGDNPKDSPNWRIYPPPPEPVWVGDRERSGPGSRIAKSEGNSLSNSLVLTEEESHQDAETSLGGRDAKPTYKKRKEGVNIGEDFDIREVGIPGPCEGTFELDETGIFQVYANAKARDASSPLVAVPTIREFYMDLDEILYTSSDGPCKSLAFQRLAYLEARFNLYILLNGYQETADCKRVPHRDFYNVRKVDTHVHHSACMNQKHLLRFIKSKMRKFPDEIVLYRDGKHLTLAEVFESIKLTAYDLSIDTLDMHAHTDSFHRFDKFNLKYNPIGESRLRTIFLKTDNFINGRYLAEITKEVISDLESSKYQMVEWRISIYGKSLDEWDKLAAWVVDNRLFSHNVRWLIQIPRLFDVYKESGIMANFEQIIKNIFLPLFEVTRDPSSHPKLHIMLQRVIGFDSVDDESKVERRLYKKFPPPRQWDSKQNPPYSYWIYFLYANMVSLNSWRKQLGYNTFLLRPHCGEAGDSEHLAVAALCCHSISHGLLLRKVPLLQYVFYLEQIGIAMSPLSNNALFLTYERNPFPHFFRRGLNVSLSTDDPLQFAFTKEPLIEEYAVAAQIYKLSPVDMCELAKNSVLQSGYELSIKQHWLGKDFLIPGKMGNDTSKTNVPDVRAEFRYQTLREELEMIRKYTTPPSETAASPRPTQRGPESPGVSMQQQHRVNGSEASGAVPSSPAARGPALPSPHLTPGMEGQVFPSGAPLLDSPLDLSAPTEGFRELQISGSEPRLWPGMISRRHRVDSLRQSSVQDAEGPVSATSPPRRRQTNDSDRRD